MLEISGLTAGYGQMTALRDVSLTLGAGEVLAVIGANGAGKSTLLKTISGLLVPSSGTIRLGGEDITRLPAYVRARRGIALVPEGRKLFRSLTVEENLKVPASAGRAGTWTLESVYELLPLLSDRRARIAGDLSGGEQQATAIGRALLANPDVLLLDEVSLGLAPAVVAQVYEVVPRILAEGTAVLLVEQDVHQAMRMSTSVHCLLQGRTSLTGSDLSAEEVSRAYFGY
ncbi:Branched-chain amino acid transport ATP-binding protein LivF (TC 3.A.1.4.1) [Actinomycetales bacterium JB111]|nr:Branched-chain amino acid transport ATP-binding protein LivF (TC 3.A.1.4.1) [Actinomycetales bacterium JB111]